MSISAKFIETPLYAPVYVLCVQMFSVDFDGAKFCLQWQTTISQLGA